MVTDVELGLANVVAAAVPVETIAPAASSASMRMSIVPESFCGI
jgi:hypothetical protein